jgi:hypothetical protein
MYLRGFSLFHCFTSLVLFRMSHPTSRKTVVILLEESTGATTTIHCPYTSPSTSDLRNLVSPYFPNTAKSHIGIFESNKDDNTFIAASSADPALLANLAMVSRAYLHAELSLYRLGGLLPGRGPDQSSCRIRGTSASKKLAEGADDIAREVKPHPNP